MRREEIIKKLQAFFEKHKQFRIAILFGSVARGDIKQESDVDIAVLAEHELSWLEQGNLSLELEKICKREVGIVDLRKIY